MKFEEAFIFLEKGEKIKRKSWANKDYWLDKKDKDQKEDPCISLSDIKADDWVRDSKQKRGKKNV